MSVNKISPGPACDGDGKRLFIEVTGIKHDEQQCIKLFDEEDKTEQEFLKKEVDFCKKEELKAETVKDSCIHSWIWSKQTKPLNAWLAVKTQSEDNTESKDIMLPLYDDVVPSKRVDGRQNYLLHAIMPLTLMPSFDPAIKDKDRLAPVKDKDRLAPVRNGYLYVFNRGRAWREIEIRTQDDGSVQLKDVHLYAYRAGRDKPFSSDPRVATGVPLNDIWLPAKDNKSGVLGRIAYSEVQWSGARLNYLEENKDAQAERTVAFSQVNIDNNVDLIKASTLKKTMRSRAVEVELKLANPLLFNRDLSDKYIKGLYQKVKSEQQKLQQEGGSVPDSYADLELEYGAKCAALAEITNATKQGIAFDCVKEKSPDYLKDAVDRKLFVLPFLDQSFILRHHSAMTLSCFQYLQDVQKQAGKEPHAHSAELVQRIIMPKKMGDKTNPYYKYSDEVGSNLMGTFHRRVHSIERSQFRRDCRVLQDALAKVLNDEKTAICLKDFSSLNDINGAMAHILASSALGALNIDPDAIDTLLPAEDKKPHAHVNTLAKVFNPADKHPLHEILFVSTDEVPLDCKYTPPEGDNDGSGLATPANIACWANDNLLMSDDKIETLDLLNATKMVDNGEGQFGNFRRISGVMGNIFDSMFSSLLAFQTAVMNNTIKIDFTALYAPALSTLKAVNSKYLSEMKYVPTTGEAVKGYVVGVHGAGLKYGVPEGADSYVYGKGKGNVAYGSLHDDNGQLIASTKKSQLNEGAIAGAALSRQKVSVVILPEESELAKDQMMQRQVLKDVHKQGRSISNSYEKLRMPYWLVAIEIINLKMTLDGLKTESNAAKIGANIISATADLGISLVNAHNLLANNTSRLAKQSEKIIYSFSDETIARFTSASGKIGLVQHLQVLKMAGFAAGMLTAGIAVWDTVRLYSAKDNDAAIAMGMVAVGTAMTSIASGLFTSSSAFLGFGPIAWLGIGIAVAGGLLYYYFKDTPIETWLKNGPFGEAPATDGDYAKLQDPKEAFMQLINIVMSLSISTYPIDKIKFPAAAIAKFKQRGVTHGIFVRSNLLQLLNAEQVNLRFFARQAIKKSTKDTTRANMGKVNPDVEIINVAKANSPIIEAIDSIEGKLYLVNFNLKVPQDKSELVWLWSRFREESFQPHFSVRAQLTINELAFPRLPLDQLTQVATPKDAPKFTAKDYYWADELHYPLR
ncbi:hypothetical protein [Shewanella surugensis]|uniref:Uncharacterized protein n=1 Tax=Shewanella surugensis TaxID=212020 RepID=A0ABT0L5K4_9GAMM|nr:hypothetical protein [Shewanella surugensis]MCL1122972.1 hypothetical protein [Shewanella surugensis]